MNRHSLHRTGVLAWSIAGPIFVVSIFVLLAATYSHIGIAPAAAAGSFDGSYQGTFTLSHSTGNFCEDTATDQVMSVSGDQLYIERKSMHGSPLLLSGTIDTNGSVSASGVAAKEDPHYIGRAIFYTLLGKIENGRFSGELQNRGCSWTVKMAR